MNNSALHDWLSKAIGKKLLSIEGLVYFFEGSRIDPPQEVGFFFENCDFGKILCHKDGESVLFSTELIRGCDLGEYGEQNPVSLSDEPFFESFIGKKLDLALIVCFSNEKKIAGVCFSFAGGSRLIVLNLGDEIFFLMKCL